MARTAGRTAIASATSTRILDVVSRQKHPMGRTLRVVRDAWRSGGQFTNASIGCICYSAGYMRGDGGFALSDFPEIWQPWLADLSRP